MAGTPKDRPIQAGDIFEDRDTRPGYKGRQVVVIDPAYKFASGNKPKALVENMNGDRKGRRTTVSHDGLRKRFAQVWPKPEGGR